MKNKKGKPVWVLLPSTDTPGHVMFVDVNGARVGTEAGPLLPMVRYALAAGAIILDPQFMKWGEA